MRRSFVLALGLTVSALGPVSALEESALESSSLEGTSSLRGSSASMERQNAVARENDFSFLRTSRQILALVEEGRLTPLMGNEDYRLANVSHPAARPVLKTFVERLAAQYRASCGEKLVVTSLTRPLSEQPRNASDLSVHPAGMAVDLRIPANGSCRTWLESTLLSMERSSLLDVTRESRPPHYHIAVFPDTYGPYADQLIAEETAAAKVQAAADAAAAKVARAAALAAANAAPATRAEITPGPGLLATLLYSVVVLSGMVALMFVVRGKPNP